ncbi:DUF3769 domain-containing protein [Pantanalinema rosaneae CENA516]|uniref:DUF3769 domain-containing protein n=1 Tax=Pantanalinema rosaneae TaxID=1620701 RepID=UPI003D6FF942
MPYSALPPDSPPIVIASPAAEASRPASLVTAVEGIAAPVSEISTAQPSPPETFPPESSATSHTIADLPEATPGANAAALGSPLAIGYVQATPPPVSQPSDAPPLNPRAVTRSTVSRSEATSVPTTTTATPAARVSQPGPIEPSPPSTTVRSRQLTAGTPPPPRSTAPETTASERQVATQLATAGTSPSVYSLSGSNRQLSGQEEAALVRKLDEAMDLDELLNEFADQDWEATLAAMQQVKANSAGTVAQINRPLLPNRNQPSLTQPGAAPVLIPNTGRPTTPLPPSAPSATDELPPATTTPTSVEQPTNGTGLPAVPAGQSPTPPGQPIPPANPGVSPLELKADRQDYDERRQIFTAEGNVEMRFRGAVLTADRLQVNLNNRLAVAEGNVGLIRGEQILRGRRFEYNIVQNIGSVQGARGDIYLPTVSTDTSAALANDATAGATLSRPPSERALAQQPLTGIAPTGGFATGIGVGPNASLLPGLVPQGGTVRRLRFEAETLDFNPDGWVAQNIDITNDPFSPPELVLRADRATLTRLSPLRDEVRATRPRLVFDQRFTLPLLVSRVVLDRRERQPGLLQFGFDERDRGGFFIERNFDVFTSPTFSLNVTPQFFVQRAFFNGSKTGVSVDDRSSGVFDPNNFGLKANLDLLLSPRTQVVGKANLTTLDPSEFEDQARASLRLQQLIGTHTLALEASYRDRLYNGTLGFQTVQSSFGAVFTSPRNLVIGNTGINLSYQVGFQNITADTDRSSLLAAVRDNNRTNLSRFQAATALSKAFVLWRGAYLPATPTEGLRYSPVQVVPYIAISTGLTGVFSAYSNGETQSDLGGNVTLFGQFGNFSRNFLDYTAFNIGYTQRFTDGQSPFFFDRVVDRRVVTAGLTQQIYGPFRVGVQASFSLTEDESFSTDYFIEYARRTYSIMARYNPILQVGSLSFRINDFNWTGGTEPFAGTDITPVSGGVIRR